MAGYDNVSDTVQLIVDAAIESEMNDWGFPGTIEGGFVGSAPYPGDGTFYYDAYIAGPNGGRGSPVGVAVDAYGEQLVLPFDPREIYSRWARDVPEVFSRWLDLPDPGSFDASIGVLRDAANSLAAGGAIAQGEGAGTTVSSGNAALAGDLTYVESEIAQYNGAAIDAFGRNYVDRLRPVVSGQHLVLAVLGTVIAGEKEVWSNARDDVATIAEDALAAMLATVQGNGISLTFVFKVAASVAAAATIFASGGTAAPAIGALSTTLGIVARFLPSDAGDPPEVPLGGANAGEVFGNLESAIRQLNVLLTDQELQLRNCAARVHGEVVSVPGAYDVAAPAELLTTTEPSDLYTANEIVILPHLRQIAEVIGDISDVLANAGNTVSSAAGDGAWARDPSIGLSRRGHYFEWNLLLEKVVDLLLDTTVELRSAGQRLVWVADEFDGTDADVESRMQLPHAI